MIVPGYFEDLSVLHENMLPVRSYYVPSSGPGEAPADQPLREASGRLRMLSGCEWLFRYYGSIYDLKEEFFHKFYLMTYELLLLLHEHNMFLLFEELD